MNIYHWGIRRAQCCQLESLGKGFIITSTKNPIRETQRYYMQTNERHATNLLVILLLEWECDHT